MEFLRRWWARLRRFWRAQRRGSEPARLPALVSRERLPDDLRDALDALPKRGAASDAVRAAASDYCHLARVLEGPASTGDAVDDVDLLSEAEELLRAMLQRAPHVAVLASVAGERAHDRSGRESAGEALLSLRDDQRRLHELTSAALRYAASGDPGDRERMTGWNRR